jgi:hypothetical protein
VRPGYYGGALKYKAGSYSYSFPVTAAVTDEEGVLNAPAMELNLIDMPEKVYAGGDSGVAIGSAVLSRGPGSYYIGEAASYMRGRSVNWSVQITSGSAAALGIEPLGDNSANIVLSSVSGSGSVSYKVKLTVDGTSYTKTGTLTVVAASAGLPDPTLGRSVYYAKVGETLTVPKSLYERAGGSILQGTANWNPGAVLPAIGYEYSESDAAIRATFYMEGTFTSSVTVTVGNVRYVLPLTFVIGSEPAQRYVIKLPAALTTIEKNAFAGSSAEIVDLRGTKVKTIASGAFKNCIDLVEIHIPAGVTSIASDAFYGCLNLTIVCAPGSQAETYAIAHDIPVQYE